MDILLLNPPASEPAKYKDATLFPPLGLFYLAGVLKRAGHKVKVIDAYALSIKRGYTLSNLVIDVQSLKPSVIGITTMTINREIIRKTIKAIREAYKCSIVLGGAHITALPQEVAELGADYGIYGEGEDSFLELINKIGQKGGIKRIKGVIYNDGSFCKRDYICNLDEIPIPSWELMDFKLYGSWRIGKSMVLLTSRGCPYNCIFCHKPIFGNVFRAHSPERVIQEIETLKSYGVGDIKIYDDTFTMNRERVIKICNNLIERKINIKWSCATRIDRVDKEMLCLMKQAGCYSISFGIESGS